MDPALFRNWPEFSPGSFGVVRKRRRSDAMVFPSPRQRRRTFGYVTLYTAAAQDAIELRHQQAEERELQVSIA